MTTIFSTIMLAALSSGARLFLGTFVVIVALMCFLVVRGSFKFAKKVRDTNIPGFDPLDPRYSGGAIL